MDKYSLIKKFSSEISSTLDIASLASLINSFAVAELGAENSSVTINEKSYPHRKRDNIFSDIEKILIPYSKKLMRSFSMNSPCSESMLSGIDGISGFSLGIVSFPLISRGKMIGCIMLYFSRMPSEDVYDFLQVFSELSSASAMNCISYRLLEEKSVTDSLTGLRNRMSFDSELESAATACPGKPVSLMLADIDHFKIYNDMKGHQKGDSALALVASCISKSNPDSATFRYGGEEFAVILKSAGQDEALAAAESARKSVESLSGLTISIGVVTCRNSSCTASELVKEADNALYRAKNSGRNRISSSLIIDRNIAPIDIEAASSMGNK